MGLGIDRNAILDNQGLGTVGPFCWRRAGVEMAFGFYERPETLPGLQNVGVAAVKERSR
jgi:hypothetical protein